MDTIVLITDGDIDGIMKVLNSCQVWIHIWLTFFCLLFLFFFLQHDGKPFCHKPCYAALYGPKGKNQIYYYVQKTSSSINKSNPDVGVWVHTDMFSDAETGINNIFGFKHSEASWGILLTCSCWSLLCSASTELLVLNFLLRMLSYLDNSFNGDCEECKPERSEHQRRVWSLQIGTSAMDCILIQKPSGDTKHTCLSAQFSQKWNALTRNRFSACLRHYSVFISIHLIDHTRWPVGYFYCIFDAEDLLFRFSSSTVVCLLCFDCPQ